MDDLIGEFITETSESLGTLDVELVKLEQNPNDKNILSNIFRLVHTIKGTCGFLGLPRLEAVAHSGENILGKIRDGEIEADTDTISVVLQSIDQIKYLIEYLAEHGEEPAGDDAQLIATLQAYIEQADASAQTPAEAQKAKPQPAADADKITQSLPETEGGLDREVLDELERAFREAVPTVDGGGAVPPPQAEVAAEATQAAAAPAVPVEQPATSAETPAAAKPRPAGQEANKARDKAIQEGLAADAKDKEGGGSSNLANQSIRVNLSVLENLMQMVGELVLTRNQLLQIVRNRDDSELKTPLQHLSQITTELQEGVMKTRMQPIGNAWAKFPRLIRDLSHDLGKKIELHMEGAETELDRQLLELIKDPLTHMVRNSCDHGLELPHERLDTGKPEMGTVTLRAYHEGGHIIIEIADNGRGVNIERVKRKVIENGLEDPDELEKMSDEQIMQFIFCAGFSTAEKVTSVSGRGVGMDVVRTNIEKIGGTVELSSTPGYGSTFHIKIPLTLAIVSVLIVESGGERFALPQINVLELVRSASDSDYQIEQINQASVLRLRDKLLPLLNLSEALHLPPVVREPSELDIELGDNDLEEQYIVVCKVGGTQFGIVVDRIFDTEEIVVKPVNSLLKHIAFYSGNTILGDGRVIMILDPNGLARHLGNAEATARSEEDKTDQHNKQERLVSFLLFKTEGGAPKAVPLELVSRLEEIETKDIEYSGDMPVIQYRDDLMRLTALHDKKIPDKPDCEVIVFTYDSKIAGLMVDEIMDIVEAPLQVKLTSEDDAYIGSMVIGGRTTDVVDVGYLLREMIDEEALEALQLSYKPDNYRLMLVEDSIFFRKLTIPFLSKLGHHVNGFADAKAALQALREGKETYDVIVTDIEMPEMDGFEFAQEVRSNPEWDDIPVIAFTSTINQQFIERGREIGMQDFILKTDREELVQSISKLLVADKEVA